MDYSGYALPAPIECIIKWWWSVMMNVCNKGYSVCVCGRRWVQQAALNYHYLCTKLHCVYHGRLKSERTLSLISITCGLQPSHVWRSSSYGIWCLDAQRVLPELLKHLVLWKCQDLHTGWQNVTTQITHIFSSTVMRISYHTSHLCPACAGHLKYW